MLITEREKRTLLYILPLVVLLAILLYILTTKSPLLQTKNVGCIICHPAKFYSNPHPPYAKLFCLSCHNRHKDGGRGPSTLKQNVPNLCFQCHQPMVQKFLSHEIKHKPVVKGKCLTCHNPHGSDNSYMFVDKPGNVCRSCHYLTKFTPKRDQHRPFEEGWCIVCHAGHSSNVAARLKEPQKNLCLGCHQPIALSTNMQYQMKPFVEGKCTGCHNPHASDNNKQLQKPLVELCVSCHGQISDQLQQSSAHPVLKRNLITCLNCHVPHGSPYAKLLQRPFDKSVSGCGACHLPHGSGSPNLMKTDTNGGLDVSSVCEQCHRATVYDQPYTHPVKNKFDPNAQERLSCISTCHKGLYWPNMNTFDNEICLMCHTGHNSPAAAIGSDKARETKILRTSVEEISNTKWQDAPPPGVTVEAPRVYIQAPGGGTKVNSSNIVPEATKLIGEYHRLSNGEQYKIKLDSGCMLCHKVANLP